MCETPKAYTSDHPVARKAHRCCECSQIIRPGETYWRFSGVYDGWCETFKTCSTCEALRNQIEAEGSDCIAFGCLRDEVFDGCRITAEVQALLPGHWLMDFFNNAMESMPLTPREELWEKDHPRRGRIGPVDRWWHPATPTMAGIDYYRQVEEGERKPYFTDTWMEDKTSA